MSLREIVEKFSDYITNLSRQGISHAEIARKLVSEKGVVIGEAKPDSLRRQITIFFSELKPENSYPQDEGSEDVEQNIRKKFEMEDVDDNVIQDIEEEESTLAKSAYKKYKHSTAYYYDEAKDLYIVYIKNKPYKFTGTIVRDMKSRYSNMDGSPETINEVCRNFEIPRNIFIALKSIMGWTHDSEPFTDEEMFARGEDEMVQDALQKRKFSFFQKYTRSEEKLIKDAANNWWAFKGLTLNPLAEKLENVFANYTVPKLSMPDG